MIVNPAMIGQFMRVKPLPPEQRKQRHAIVRTYESFLRLALRWRAVTILLALAMQVALFAVFIARSQLEFMPTVEPPQAQIDIELPQGSNLAASDSYVRAVEDRLQEFAPNIENIISNIGSQGIDPGGSMPGETKNSTHLSQITLDFPKLAEAKVMPSVIIENVRASMKGIPGADVRIDQMNMGPPTGPPVNIEISGDDYETLAALAQDIQGEIKGMPELVDIRDDYHKGKPEVRIIIDREKAWKMGLNTQFIGLTVQTAIEGRKASEYREGDEEYDVTVRFPASFRENLNNLENMNLINLAGQAVPFSAVAHIEQGAGMGSIKRINRKRTVTVSAEVIGDRQPIDVLKDVQARLAGFVMPAGYSVAYTGENEDTQETQEFLVRAFGVALLLVALAIVAQFNSVLQTIVIMTSVVLSIGGVILGLLICDMPFGILMTGIGCISLAGVVVNNGIVLLDFVNQLRARGYSLDDAVVEAGIIRFRPVMLTATTNVLGLVPMALGVNFDFKTFQWSSGGESAQWWGPMAIAIIFGMTFATVLTLVFVPTLYTYAVDLGNVFRRRPSPHPIAEPVAK